MKTPAIIMHTRPIMENDILVELFSRDMGRICVFAKFAQSKKPRFGGRLHTLNMVQASINQRGRAMSLGDIRVISSFNEIKKSYQKMQVAYQFLHVIRSMTQINQENSEMYSVLCAHLNKLNTIESGANANKSEFYQQMLSIEGILSNDEKDNEKNYIKMIESYTSLKLKDIL